MNEMISKEKLNSLNRACERLGANQYLYSLNAEKQMGELVWTFKNSSAVFDAISSTAQKTAVKAGRVAEQIHTETFNADAILKGSDIRAYNDNKEDLNNLFWYMSGHIKNDNPDIIITKNGEVVSKAQLKYYKNGESTANALREIKDGQVKYAENDQFLVASDKVKTTISAAKKTQLWEEGKSVPREKVIDATQQVQDKTTGQLKFDDVESRETTLKEAREIGRKGKDAETRKDYIKNFENQSTVQQMTTAGLSAAAITAIISGITNTLVYVEKCRNGEVEPIEAVGHVALNTALASADSAFKAAASTGIISNLVKNEIIQATGNAFISGGVFTAVGLACDFSKDLILCATGKISETELKDRTAKNCVFAPATFLGSTIGTSVALSLGLGAVGSVFGGVIGGVIVSAALQFAIENGIEKPYRELVAGQAQFVEGMKIFNEMLASIDKAMVLTDFFIQNTKTTMAKIPAKKKIIDRQMSEIDDILRSY